MGVRKLRLIYSPTPEWERVRAFYRDALGLAEIGSWSEPGDRGVFLGGVPGEIELMELDAAALDVLPGPGGWSLAVQVEDVEAERARLASSPDALPGPIRTRSWGSRDFVVRDPAGGVVLVFEEGGG